MKWFEMKNSTDTTADLYFYGDIVADEWGKWVDDDCCPADVTNALKECAGKDLNIYINSGGGSVFGGMAIYNILKRHNCKKTVHIDGLAASIASVIAMAGDEIVMPSNSYLMVHKPWTSAWGENADGFRKLADTLDVLEQGIMNVYESKLAEGVEIDTVKQLVADETWLTGEQASKYFNVTLVGSVNASNCASDCFKNYTKIPKALTEKPKEANNDLKNKLLLELELLSQ